MKKILMIGFVAMLAACTNTVKPEYEKDNLVQLKQEPRNCTYLYKLNADASVYSHDDAIQYLKNRIAEQNKSGNAFWLEKDEKQQNDWVMFGPEHRYVMTARVYDCASLK